MLGKKQREKLIEVGFWKNASGTEEGRQEVKAAQDYISPKEMEIVLEYIAHSTDEDHYMGWANCRACDAHLGSCDMVTPDNKFIFPQMYEHYIIKHNVAPPNDFITSAIEWHEKQ